MEKNAGADSDLPPASPEISGEEYEALKLRLAASKFRSRFRLGQKELHIVAETGVPVLRGQCRKFLQERLAPAHPRNDGRQTPMRGHPCFIAQHATGCCCRNCLAKWHRIPAGRALTEAEIDFITSIVMRWIAEHADGAEEIPVTPDLFSD